MAQVQCYWLEESGKIKRSFRRYRMSEVEPAPGDKCPGPYSYHNAQAPLDEIDWPVKTVIEAFTSQFPHDDPRWPKKCAECDYVFQESDQWQIFTDTLYQRTDTGQIVTLADAPPGAMWDAWWMGDHYKGRDGLHLCVLLPDGTHWTVDGPSSGGGPGWSRTGQPPKVTASPSILTIKYHGYLIDGMLNQC
jgi:hypothetical protein